MIARRPRIDGESSPASKLNIWLNVMVGAGTVIGFFISVVILTSNITQRFTEVSGKVDTVSTKVDSSTTLLQTKQDALTKNFEANVQEQQTFRASVQSLFGKVFDSQQKLADQINQERVDRLNDAVKKK